MNDFAKASARAFIILLAIMLIPTLVYGFVWWEGSPNFILNETSDFDSGDKWEYLNVTSTETITNTFHVNEDTIELASMYGDTFNSTATTCNSWKWEGGQSNMFYATTGGSCDINSTYEGKAYMTNTGNQQALTLNVSVGGDFNVSYQASRTVNNAIVGIQGLFIRHGTAGGNNSQIFVQKSGSTYTSNANCWNTTGDINNTQVGILQADLSDYEIRAERIGDRISLYLKMNDTDGEILGCTVAPAFEYDAMVYLYNQGVIAGEMATTFNEVNVTADYMNSSVHYDPVLGYVWTYHDSHLRSGNWTSALQTFVAGEPINRLRINLTADSENYLDKIEILDSADATIYSDDTNSASSGIATYILPDIEEDFKVRVYLVGNGSSTPTIYDILVDKQEYTSLYAVELEVNDTTITSDSYQQIFIEEFNTTTLEAFGLMSSFNLEKTSGGGTSIISARVYIDGVQYHQENVRTISSINQIGSTGLFPITFNLTEGQHNLSVEMARTGNGNVDLTNIDFVLGKFNTTADYLVRGQLINVTYDYESTAWSNGYNWTVTKDINSPTYHGGKLSVTATDHDHIWLNMTNYNTSETSRNVLRHISGATSLGSVGLAYLNTNTSETHNMTIGSRTENGETITITGTLFDFDLYDTDNNVINHFQANNTSLSETTPMTIGDDWELIDEELLRMRNGTGIFISSTISFNSTSGTQTAGFKINVSNSTDGCESNKERYLADNDDIGNAYFYVVCNRDLDIGQNYTVHLWGRAGADEVTSETIQIMTESLSAMEVTNFSLTDLGIAPSISIQSPDTTETTSDIWFNVTTNQDNTDWCGVSIDGAANYTLVNATGNWANLTANVTAGVHYAHFYCNNTDGLMGETDDYYFSIIEGYDEAAVILGLIILTGILIYLGANVNRRELQLLFISIGLLMVSVTVFCMTIVLTANSVTTIDETMVGLFSGTMWVFIFVISYFIVMFIKSVFEEAAQLKEY